MNLRPAFACLTALVLTGSALAADLPKRKSGLWEMKTQMENVPSQGPMQMCVDQNSDNIMQERAKEKVNCPTMDISRAPGKVTIHVVCKMEDGTTTTTDSVITGDFETSYRNDMRIRYTPAKHGMSDMKMVQEARWLGPCKPGQKPGDIMMPGMPGGGQVNIQQMMNDPQMREMMKRQQQGR